MNGTPNQQVNLAHPIPVLILYGTAIVTEDGIIHFYDDIYGHDRRIEQIELSDEAGGRGEAGRRTRGSISGHRTKLATTKRSAS
jgi:hypothetical protein